jgi:hypothetical protein
MLESEGRMILDGRMYEMRSCTYQTCVLGKVTHFLC